MPHSVFPPPVFGWKQLHKKRSERPRPLISPGHRNGICHRQGNSVWIKILWLRLLRPWTRGSYPYARVPLPLAEPPTRSGERRYGPRGTARRGLDLGRGPARAHAPGERALPDLFVWGRLTIDQVLAHLEASERARMRPRQGAKRDGAMLASPNNATRATNRRHSAKGSWLLQNSPPWAAGVA